MHFPNLQHLALPASLMSSRAYATIRSPFPHARESPYVNFWYTLPSDAQISARGAALAEAAQTEQHFIHCLTSQLPSPNTPTSISAPVAAPKLEEIVYTRPATAHDRTDSSISYSVHESNTRPRLQTQFAAQGSVDALPRNRIPRRASLYSRWRGAAQDSNVPPLLAAAGGGLILGETLYQVYKLGVVSSPRVVMGTVVGMAAVSGALSA